MSKKNLLIEEMDDDLQSRHLCKDCVSETVFSDFIKENGQKGKCAFCNKNKNNVIALESFCEFVDEKFKESYGHGSEFPYFEGDSDRPSYDTYGEAYNDIIGQMLGCDYDVQEAISDLLEQMDDYDPRDGGDPKQSRHKTTQKE